MPVISITCLVYLLQYLFSFGRLHCRIHQPQILHYPLLQEVSLHFPIWVCQNYLPLNQVFYLFLLLQCIFWKRYSICWLQLIQYSSRVSWQSQNSILNFPIFFENRETSFEAWASSFNFQGLIIGFQGLSFKTLKEFINDLQQRFSMKWFNSWKQNYSNEHNNWCAALFAQTHFEWTHAIFFHAFSTRHMCLAYLHRSW